MSDGREEFTRRLDRILRRHRAMAHGYTASLRGDGLVVVHPRKVQFKLPVRGFVLLMFFFMVFKGFMVASLGYEGYSERLTVLRGGTVFEQAGAFVMGIDPVSETIANGFSAVLN